MSPKLQRNIKRNRARLATSGPHGTVATNPALRAAPTTAPTHYKGRPSRRAGSDKGQGEWRTVSQNYSTPVTIDSRWSA